MQKKLSTSLLLATLVAVGIGSTANASHPELIDYKESGASTLARLGDVTGSADAPLEVQRRLHNKGQDAALVPCEEQRSGATLKFTQTTEEPSPFEQPNYWRALLVKSASAGVYFTVFAADQPEIPIVGFIGLPGYMRHGGFSAVGKAVGAGAGGIIGGAIGGAIAQIIGDTNIVVPAFSIGVAVGYGVSTVVQDYLSYGWKRLLGTTKTIKHQTYEIKK